MNDGDDTRDELMQATYDALRKRGYADLRMQDIADESSKSKAALHYHYDSKRDLLAAFLAYLYEGFAERIDDPEGETPGEQLRSLVEQLLTPEDRDSHREFHTVLLEIKAQGPYDDRFREGIQRFDDLLHDRLASLLAAGQATGEVRADVDPDEAAEFVVTAIHGARTRTVSVGHPVEDVRRSLLGYVDDRLLVEDADDGDADDGAGDDAEDGTDEEVVQ